MSENERKTKKGLKRAHTRYPGLEKGVNGKFRKDGIDYDYLDQLNEKELDWLNRFSEEWNGANLLHPGKKFHRKKADRKKVFDRNNSRQRDLFNHKKNAGLLGALEDLPNGKTEGNPENMLILVIDSNREILVSSESQDDVNDASNDSKQTKKLKNT